MFYEQTTFLTLLQLVLTLFIEISIGNEYLIANNVWLKYYQNVDCLDLIISSS